MEEIDLKFHYAITQYVRQGLYASVGQPARIPSKSILSYEILEILQQTKLLALYVNVDVRSPPDKS